MTDPCDLCAHAPLEPVYQPPHSARGLTVYLCPACGLLQSLPRVAHVGGGSPTASGEADFGNLRYGRDLRAGPALAALNDWATWPDVRRILDVGSGRGAFVTQVCRWAEKAEVWAIEPDERVTGWWQDAPEQVLLNHARIEDVSLPPDFFDLIYCSHTLEHVESMAGVLRQLAAALRPGGHIYVEVPDVAQIGLDDYAEQFFLDKHLYHFSAYTLRLALENAGLSLLSSYSADHLNLWAIATRWLDGMQAEVVYWSRELVAGYDEQRPVRQARLVKIAGRVNELCKTQRVVAWGAGRIFDCLVKAGLDVSGLAGLVDSYLPLDEVHGMRVLRPGAIPQCDVVLVCSREYAAEITAAAVSRRPGTEVVRWDKI